MVFKVVLKREIIKEVESFNSNKDQLLDELAILYPNWEIVSIINPNCNKQLEINFKENKPNVKKNN